jgi:hypothetical protein
MTSLSQAQTKKFPITLGKYLAIVVPLAMGNVFTQVVVLMNPGYFDLQTALVTSLVGLAVAAVMWSIILAIPMAFIPYKGLTYLQKFIPAALLANLIIQAGLFLFGIIPTINIVLNNKHLFDKLSPA